MAEARSNKVLGGAMARVPVDATAFAHGSSRIMVNVAAVYGSRRDRDARGVGGRARRDPAPGRPAARTSTSSGTRASSAVREAHPGATWDRLRAVKRRYDTTNLFRLNRNVPPADGP